MNLEASAIEMSQSFCSHFSKEREEVNPVHHHVKTSQPPSSLLSIRLGFPVCPTECLSFLSQALFFCSSPLCSPKFILSFPLLPCRYPCLLWPGQENQRPSWALPSFPQGEGGGDANTYVIILVSLTLWGRLGLVPANIIRTSHSKSWDHSTAFSSPPRFQRIPKTMSLERSWASPRPLTLVKSVYTEPERAIQITFWKIEFQKLFSVLFSLDVWSVTIKISYRTLLRISLQITSVRRYGLLAKTCSALPSHNLRTPH